MKEGLIDAVIEQIMLDLDSGNIEPLAEMLKSVPEGNLVAFLSELTSKD